MVFILLVVTFNEEFSCKSRSLAFIIPIEEPEPNSIVTLALGIKRTTPEVALSIVWFPAPAPLGIVIPAMLEVLALLKSTVVPLLTTTLPETLILLKLFEVLLLAAKVVDPLRKLTLLAWIKAFPVVFELVKLPCKLFLPSKLTLVPLLLRSWPESWLVVTPLKVIASLLAAEFLNQNGP